MRRYTVEIAGQERTVVVERTPDGRTVARIEESGRSFAAAPDGGLLVDDRGRAFRVEAFRRNGRFTIGVGPASDTALVREGTRSRVRSRGAASRAGDEPGALRAPMPGRVLRVAVRAGDAVRAGQALVVIEAMKMENEIRAAADGTVREVVVREGQPVESGERLLNIDSGQPAA